MTTTPTGDLTDAQLAAAVRDRVAAGESCLLVVANKFSSRVLVAATATPSAWRDLGVGDIGAEATKLLQAAGKRGQLLWLGISDADPGSVDLGAAGTSAPVDAGHLRAWCKERDKITGTAGRNSEINQATRFEVASLAAWRCQFDGCGEDLRQHLAPGGKGNYSYFAHIVASSADGPRGDRVKSPQLANVASNIMLMCDKCHRRIDRVEPARFTVEVLNDMRQRNVEEVRSLLDALRYPAAQMLVIGGNIEGQSFAFDERVAEEAMWMHRLRAGGERTHWFARNGGHLGASNDPNYWGSLFRLLKNDRPRLAGLMDGTAYGGAPRLPLAVFPLHGTSVLILSGRLVGDSGSTHVFQFHRDQVGGQRGGQWAWPASAPRPAADKFKVRVHREHLPGDTDGCLLVHLTASIPSSQLPSTLYAGSQFALPTVEVTVDAPSHRVMGHPDDLDLAGRAIDEALRKLRDEWRVSTVHLVVIAPATACFRLGQKMQARHHPRFVLYERRPNAQPSGSSEFATTISISPTEVTLLSTGESTSIS